MRHPRQESHYHAEGHPTSSADTRSMGRSWLDLKVDDDHGLIRYVHVFLHIFFPPMENRVLPPLAVYAAEIMDRPIRYCFSVCSVRAIRQCCRGHS